MEENKKQVAPVSPNRIWLYRKRLGFGQKQLAMLMGNRSVTEISRYERGVRRPNLRNAIRLEIILATPVSFLFPDMRREVFREVQKQRNRHRYVRPRDDAG